MVEVFKTNVRDPHHASMLIEQIHHVFTDYKANFDLEDCDRILRIQCSSGAIKPQILISFIHERGFHAEVLPDEPLSGKPLFFGNGIFWKANPLN